MFGDYQPELQLHDSLWLGHKIDPADSVPVCIKVVSTAERDERDTFPAERLLKGAALQQAIADHSSRWAPVLQLGSDGVDSFYVTRRFPQSLQTMINRRMVLRVEEIQIIMLEIVEALIDLAHTYELPHANLKPSNVFLLSADQAYHNRIRLSDPDPTVTDLNNSAGFDVCSMGRILYSLVTLEHHTIACSAQMQFGHWKHLGPSAGKWFNLCDKMLRTVSRADVRSLADLRVQISQIRIPRPRSFAASFFF